jgi:2,4-dienoyl-CoA reductase-like NADH-dependent reductase (Old Yellow Enzyme family)
MQKKALEPGMIGGIQVKNRIVRSATHESMAENGAVGPRMLSMYSDLAKGQVGLIITGYMVFSDTDHPDPKNVSINRNADMDKLKQLTDTVHE